LSKKDRRFSGYIDMALLNKISNAAKFIIGAGGENEHQPGEYVNIIDLEKAQRLYELIILSYCK